MLRLASIHIGRYGGVDHRAGRSVFGNAVCRNTGCDYGGIVGAINCEHCVHRLCCRSIRDLNGKTVIHLGRRQPLRIAVAVIKRVADNARCNGQCRSAVSACLAIGNATIFASPAVTTQVAGVKTGRAINITLR